jgi:ribonuclease D
VPPSLIAESGPLEDLCAELAGEPFYAIDTEFHLERTYYPQLALIQVGWADQVALIDPLSVDPRPLGRILSGPGVAVFHAAEQDLDVLEAACGVVPDTVFDTQVVAGFLGLSTPSLSRLVDQMLGITLPKTDRLSDWIQRPITARQITYAAGDVAHLLALRTTMTAQLEDLGRLTWALAECAEVLGGRRARAAPEQAWWKVRDLRNLTGKSRGVAQELAAWRERRAAAADRPRRMVLSDLALLTISQRPPGNRDELKRLRGVDERHLAKGAGDEILAAVRQGLALAPGSLCLPPERRDDAAPAAAVAVATGLVRQIAENQHFDQALLASRADITNMLCGEPSRLDVGWRQSIAGESIRRLMAGEVAAVFDAGGVLTLEERSRRPVSLSSDGASAAAPVDRHPTPPA